MHRRSHAGQLVYAVAVAIPGVGYCVGVAYAQTVVRAEPYLLCHPTSWEAKAVYIKGAIPTV
jgi:hypothetical protein